MQAKSSYSSSDLDFVLSLVIMNNEDDDQTTLYISVTESRYAAPECTLLVALQRAGEKKAEKKKSKEKISAMQWGRDSCYSEDTFSATVTAL